MKFTDAEKLLLKGFNELETTGEAGRRSRHKLAVALETLYEAWKKPKKKAEWRGRAETLDRQSPGDIHQDD